MEHSLGFLVGCVMIIVMVLGGIWVQMRDMPDEEWGATLFVIVWYGVAMTLLLN